MTGAPAVQPDRDELTPRIFRALHAEFDLRKIGGTHIVVPRSTPRFAGHSLGEIARQIGEYEYPQAERSPGGDPRRYQVTGADGLRPGPRRRSCRCYFGRGPT